VRLAHMAAMENPRIKGIMVDAQEFMELAEKYEVMAVPKTVIRARQEVAFEGRMPEPGFLKFLADALQ
jgi:alkyl hydroperoxide reductase subunit AhpF